MHASPPHRLRETLADRHLVVTGTTGFVGKVWLALVLTHLPELGRLTLLVRPSGGRDARARVAHMIDTSPAFRPLRATVRGDLGRWLDDRIEVLDADITRPDLGLDDATRDRLAATADATVHIAGLTSFHPDPALGVPANVDGTVHVADLTARFRVPRLLHVSTAYVAGRREGVVDETLTPRTTPLGHALDPQRAWADARAAIAAHDTAEARIETLGRHAHDLGWPNLYTYTKGLAEQLLAERDLDLVIARPSVVECARSFPLRTWNEDLNTSGPIMWFCGLPFRALPSSADHPFDIIPVDAVARWLTVLLAAQFGGTAPRVSHFASSDVNPATFRRIVELTALGKRRHAARPDATWREKLVAELDVVPRRRDDLPWITPERAAGWARAALDALPSEPPQGLPGWLAPAWRRATPRLRAPLRRQHRLLRRLERMLVQYQPFIHDHHWVFRTDHIRDLVDALHPDDRDVWADDARTIDWRDYWLNVQYEGMVRWAFPILEGRGVPGDPPSDPPLVLGAPAPVEVPA